MQHIFAVIVIESSSTVISPALLYSRLFNLFLFWSFWADRNLAKASNPSWAPILEWDLEGKYQDSNEKYSINSFEFSILMTSRENDLLTFFRAILTFQNVQHI